MNWKNYLVAGAALVGSLFSSSDAKSMNDYFSTRQLNLTSVYTQDDSVKSSRSFMHALYDGSDAFVEFTKDDNKNWKGYLDFKKSYLLGDFKALYSANNWKEDDKNKYSGNLINLEHSIINHPLFKNSIGWGWSEKVEDGYEETRFDTSFYFENIRFSGHSREIKNEDISNKQKNNFTKTKISQTLTNYLKIDYTKSIIELDNKTHNSMLRQAMNKVPSLNMDDTLTSLDELGLFFNKKINTTELKLNAKIPYLEIMGSLKEFNITTKYTTRDTLVTPPDTIKHLFDHFEEGTGKSNRKYIKISHKNKIIKNLNFIYSNIKGSSKTDFLNTQWLPDSAESGSETKSTIYSGNLSLANKWVHNLHFTIDNFFYEDFGDTSEQVMGFNPFIEREKTKGREFGYDLIIPFASKECDRIVNDLNWRRYDGILESQEDRALRLNQYIRNWFSLSAIPKTKISLKYKLMFENPWFQHHKNKTFNLDLQQTVVNGSKVKVMPFYRGSYSIKESSFEDSIMALVEPNKIIEQNHEIGCYVYLPKKVALFAASVKYSENKRKFEGRNSYDKNWKVKLGVQKVFSPFKKKWLKNKEKK